MRYLRVRREEVETAWQSDRYSASDRSRALSILGDAVVLVRHPYERDDPGSGSGNCWCGRHQGAELHIILREPAPHDDSFVNE